MTSGTASGRPDLSGLPGLDPAWSRTVVTRDADGSARSWHVLDNGVVPAPGSGGTLLCVHGNPTWSYLWRRLLAEAPPGWRVVAPDQLGMGWSERLPPASGSPARTLARRIEDLGALTEALGVTGPVVTVGHDWGGVVSLGWAQKHTDQLRGVVLTNTAVAQPPGDRGPLLIRLAHVPLLRRFGCVTTPLFVRSTSALSRPALPGAVRDALAAPYRSAARRRSVGDFVADIPFAPGHPSRTTLDTVAEGVRSLDVPTLLLWGPRDPVFGERYLADLRERLPHARLHRFEGASHLVTEDAPQYAEVVAQWLADEVTGATAAHGAGRQPVAGTTHAAAGTPPALWTALEARAGDDDPAVVAVGGDALSWRRLHRRVVDLAAGLAAGGVRPGDRVAMLVEPSTDLTAAVYAVWRAGGVVVVADKGLGLAGMRRALRSASVDHVVAGRRGLLAAAGMRLPGTRIATRHRHRRLLRADNDLESLAEVGRRSPVPLPPDPEAECVVAFTSGSTGPAKGVVYRHRQVAAQLALLRSTYGLGPEDRLVAAFAPFALLGPGLGIGSAVPDVDITAPGTLTAAALADAVHAVDATIVFASPAALRNVVTTAGALTEGQRRALAGVRLLVSAGAPVPVALLSSVATLLPSAGLHTPYGMTEALPVTDVSLDELLAAGAGEGVCVGRPLPAVAVAVSPLSPDGAADGPLTAAPAAVGEICVHAAHVKDRYDALWATERASSRDAGWHRTGDVGHLDAAGRLWVEGRLAHVVTTAQGVVTPVGVEQRVETLAHVRACATVGVGPTGAQVVVVVVVTEEAGRLAVAPVGLTDQVRAVAAVPVAAVLTTAALPVDVRHASKVDRTAVAAEAAALLAGG